MDTSRRAVESYWRSRMIDAATSDEDKVAPVYKLEEICELLRSSHVSIVKEVSDFILKRLDHKSPIVKQKWEKSVEFRREMQRHSIAVSPIASLQGLFVETAQEAISAIFAGEESKPAPSEDLNRRIEGFGNTNYEISSSSASSDDRKSFFSEVVGIGSASIKQDLARLLQHIHSRRTIMVVIGASNLRRSLTTERDHDSSLSPAISTNSAAGTWGQETRVNRVKQQTEFQVLRRSLHPGGVRLQPTRDALQVFLAEALKLDAVRMKAVCVLESIVRKKDDEHFQIVASYFAENRDSVVQCSESPQASLREKATKELLRKRVSCKSRDSCSSDADLLDTSGPDDFYGNENFTQTQMDNLGHTVSATAPVTDLFGDSLITGLSTTEQKNEDDPFADVSFYTNEEKEQTDDLFSGLTIDNKDNTNDSNIFTSTNNSRPELVDIFSSSSESYLHEPTVGKDMNDLMAGLSGNTFSDLKTQQNQPISSDGLNGMFGSQMNVNPNASFPWGLCLYNMPPNMMFNPAFASQQMNYGVMGSFLAQQQLLATMSNFQQLGNSRRWILFSLPDIFNPALPAQNHSTILNNPKKEKQSLRFCLGKFAFLLDHLSAARDPKRVV
ncbi:hypothetical protein MKW92_017986 [Papaver armeniacum]|nr:hypothetical protein MKW92_017986 [Papaver armeniacum]